MMNKATIINIVKNTAIAALSLSAVYLLMLAMNTSPAQLYKKLINSNENPAVSSEALDTDSVLTSTPQVILLTDKFDTYSSAHYAAKYDYQSKQRLYSQLSVTLGEAFGSATEPEKINEKDWRTALSEDGFFFDYLYPQSLRLIALKLGTTCPEGIGETLVSRLILATFGDNYYLYYKDTESGECFRLKTALEKNSLSAFFSNIDLPSASFGFELSGDTTPDPYFVFSNEPLSIPAVQTQIPILTESEISAVKSVFNINERTSRGYSESDGSTIYVDSSKNLRVSPTGNIVFTAPASEGIPIKATGETAALSDCILSAASLVSATIAPLSGAAEIGISGIEGSLQSGSLSLTFCYYVNGTPVNTGVGGWCAKVEIESYTIIKVDLVYRTYSTLTNTLVVLPEKQAAIEASSGGGSPQLFYTDTAGAVTAMWYSIR